MINFIRPAGLCLTGISLMFCLAGCNSDDHRIRTQTIRVTSLDEILPLDRTQVRPVLYTHASGFEKLPVRIAKAKFISTVLPAILIARFEVEQNRSKLIRLRNTSYWSGEDSIFYLKIKSRYRAKEIDDLIVRMSALPVSIVLAQAAMESGWGKSRFFIQGNNLFGIWSYSSSEPRIPALVKRKNKRIFLKTYPDLSHSITNYYEVIGRAKSYRGLRDKLAKTDDPLALLPFLNPFSERGAVYTRQLKRMIVRNDRMRYDHYEIDPDYID